MILVEACVGPFRSMNTMQTVTIDPKVTVLVGMNEAGKTIFLRALLKSSDALGLETFDPVKDFPRRNLAAYLRQHKISPEEVARLSFALSDAEVRTLNNRLGLALARGYRFTSTHRYDNSTQLEIEVDEASAVDSFAAALSPNASAALAGADALRDVPALLRSVTLTDTDRSALAKLEARIQAAGPGSVVRSEVAAFVSGKVPRFLYFSEYDVLPGKVSLSDLAQRVLQAKGDPKQLTARHRAVLALLRMADVSVADLAMPRGYEELKAKVEAVSLTLTDQIMEFWKQNEDLEIEVDIKSDPFDEVPFNSGPNLYLRIKNRRHRGISMPFDQRSRGFIWFFSFLVWFDSVQQQLDAASKTARSPVILLLDEPGLALHALAQADFLRYIDRLALSHQVIYTTHSPFMLRPDRLQQVRLVEDRPGVGTIITHELAGVDPRTYFPIQAALSWTLAQSLLVARRNLLVDGPTELLYLRLASSLLQAQGQAGLPEDVTIVPIGGADKAALFMTQIDAGDSRAVVLHDGSVVPALGLSAPLRQRLLDEQSLLAVSRFRTVVPQTATEPADGVDAGGSEPTDAAFAAAPEVGGPERPDLACHIEDLFDPELIVTCFNRVYAAKPAAWQARLQDLPPGERIIERLSAWLRAQRGHPHAEQSLDRYALASRLAAQPPASLDAETQARFAALFEAVDQLWRRPPPAGSHGARERAASARFTPARKSRSD